MFLASDTGTAHPFAAEGIVSMTFFIRLENCCVSAAPGAEYPHRVPQGRNVDRKNIQAKEKIDRTSARSHPFQIAVSRGNQTCIGPNRARASQRSNSLLQHAEQFGFAIREEFLLFRPGKSCRHRRLRSGQCGCAIAPVNAPFSCPNSFAFQQTGRNGAQLSLTKGFGAPRTQIMNPARNQLLSRACLAVNQHCRIGWRDGFHPLQALRREALFPMI